MDANSLQALFPSIPVEYLVPKANQIMIPYAPGFRPVPVKQFIHSGIVRGIVKNISAAHSVIIANYLNAILPAYGLDQVDVFEEFFPNIAHESAGFRLKEENMSYSWQRLCAIFPKYFPTDAIAKQYHRQPEKIGNLVYANRMGNNAHNGYANRGGGYMMLTGELVYTAYANYKDMPVDVIRQLVRTDEYYAIDSACWFFAVYKSLKTLAQRNEFLTLCKRINGGTIGYQDREDYYLTTKRMLRAA